MPRWIPVNCPKCGVPCEVQEGTPVGRSIECIECHKSFTWRDIVVAGTFPQGRIIGVVRGSGNDMALGKSALTGAAMVGPARKTVTAPQLDLLTELKKRIIGQDHVLDEITSTFYRWEMGMGAEGQPAGSFLLMGPTGTGKTKLVESLSEIILGDPRTMIKIDCAEFQHSHEVAKLLGSPPGYLGHRETQPALTQKKLDSQFSEKYKCSFVLFDEIEKSSDALWNLLLGILDKAILTLGDNSKVDFSQTFIFMTSNLGAREMATATEGTYGFGETKQAPTSQGKLDTIALQAAKKKFTPEFLNRIDTKVVYHTLTRESLDLILDQVLFRVQKRILSGLGPRGFVLEVGEGARDFLLTEGYSKAYGARELNRVVELRVVRPLVGLIRADPHAWEDLDSVEVGVEDGKCTFEKVH